MLSKTAVLVLGLSTLLASCSPGGAVDTRPALDSINASSLLSDIKTLSSDEFEGRKPGSPGEEKTVAWLEQQFQQAGLKPGNPDGTFVQKVPLAGISSAPVSDIVVKGKHLPIELKKNFTIYSSRYVPEVDVRDSDVVFVGYGVVAPEYGWDDYKDVDVKGKTIVMLVNDPQLPDPADPSKLDPNMFKGRAMTYYGRWTYKYEIASQKGAAAAIIVHETALAGYPFEVISGGGEKFTIARPDNNMGRVAAEGWMAYDKAAELCRMAGLDLASLKKEALKKDFKPVVLPGAKAGFRIANTLRKIESRNVIAKLEGSDPAHKDEYVIYTAHWDHLGKDPTLAGDQIFNGASDNASGTAGLVALARAFTKLSTAPRRSLLFLAVTAEEQGLLGSEYYAENPLYPLKKTLADINMDEISTYGRTKDMVIVGLGNSTLDDIATDVLKAHNRTVQGDAVPENGGFYRSDHFEFARQGVPAMDPKEGVEYVGRSADWGLKRHAYFDEHDYHKPSDEVKPDWDLSGAVEDLGVYFQVGYRVAQGDTWPEWKPGMEFKARRDAMMK